MEELDLIRALLLREREASLGTFEEKIPFVSAVNYLFKPETGERLGNLYLFLSRLARHTKNLETNQTVSLLVVESEPDTPLPERKRVTLIGKTEKIRPEQEKKLLEMLYQKQFPFSEVFFALPDFEFFRFQPSAVHWIAGFGQVRNMEFSG